LFNKRIPAMLLIRLEIKFAVAAPHPKGAIAGSEDAAI
jgi:hypothetical protein